MYQVSMLAIVVLLLFILAIHPHIKKDDDREPSRLPWGCGAVEESEGDGIDD